MRPVRMNAPPQRKEDLPGYHEAWNRAFIRQTVNRDLAFSEANPLTLGGVRVRPLCLAALQDLLIAQNPYATGGRAAKLGDAMQAVWRLSIYYRPKTGNAISKLVSTYVRQRELSKVKGTAHAILKEAEDFFSESLMDMPCGTSEGQPTPPTTALAAQVVHTIARAYNWNETFILQMPMSRALQYLNLIRRDAAAESGQEYVMPQLTDSVRRTYTRLYNELWREYNDAQAKGKDSTP